MANAPDPQRVLGGYIQDVFARPFLQRMKYLYTGLPVEPGVFVVGTDDEDDYEFCDQDQAVGLIHITDPDKLAAVTAWFTSLGIDLTRPGIVNLTVITSSLNKLKWDRAAVTITVDPPTGAVLMTLPPAAVDTAELLDGAPAAGPVQKVIAHPANPYFFEIIDAYAKTYREVFLARTVPVLAHPFTVDDGNYGLVRLSLEAVAASPLGAHHPSPVRVALVKGLDLLHTKHLVPKKDPDPATFIGAKFWHASGSALDFGHTYESPALTLAAVRLNAFVIPRPTPPEGVLVPS